MSALAEALEDLSKHGLLDRVTKVDLRAGDASVELLPKIAVQQPRKKLPGETEDEEILFASS